MLAIKKHEKLAVDFFHKLRLLLIFLHCFSLPFYFVLMSGLGMLHFDFSHRGIIQILSKTFFFLSFITTTAFVSFSSRFFY